MNLCLSFQVSLLYSIILLNIIYSKKLSLTGLDGINSKNVNECGRCKIVVDSFNHWLDKTSRGKFEGGDAAWEESKLKSYARSEIRLVEIQEGLCSEVKNNQDTCYTIADEAEQLLEKWWYNKDSNSIDLFSWLCIEKLQYCCPQHHFGDNCEKCPIDSNNKICGGNGRCDGDGTRKGNGSCVCNRGYAGDLCQDCASNFFSTKSNQCRPCHKSCNGCSGEEASDCVSCKIGWELQGNICSDVNECSNPTSCHLDQYCINNEGSFRCIPCDKSCRSCNGGGVVNCTSCNSGSVLWSGVCVDIKLREELVASTLKRIFLYIGLLVITLFISRTSRILASIIIVVIALFFYFSEKSARMTTLDVILNSYF